MSRDHSLALSAEQTNLIRVHADAIQPTWRQAFLASIQDRLIGINPVTNADIVRAIDATRASFVVDFDDCC